jgi:hypothetical protein
MSRRTFTAAALGPASLCLLVAGCNSGGGGAGHGYGARPARPASQFAWLAPGPAPAGWPALHIAGGAVLPYPRGWTQQHGDAGTGTVVLRTRQGEYLGFLNLTPRQGGETMQNWDRFRVAHNANEGDRHVVLLASAGRLRFRQGRGACIRDAYTTGSGAKFIELACLIRGPHATSVVVGAAPPEAWAQSAPRLEQAISAFTA